MRLARGARGVTAYGAYLLECPIGLIEPMLALDDQRVGKRQVAMQKDPLVGREFEQKIDELPGHIDIEHGQQEMLIERREVRAELAQSVPASMAIIEGV